MKVHFMSDRYDWGTPREFLEYLQDEWGFIPNLDAAASVRNTKAPQFFSRSDDGLSKDWFGNVWLNPPYGRELPQWLEKCAREIKKEKVRCIYALIPARVDTKWFHEVVMPHAYTVHLIKGRFNFRFDEAIAGANAPFPSMLVCYHKDRIPDRCFIDTLEVPKRARGVIE